MTQTSLPPKVHVRTTINGEPMEFLVPPYESLLDTLREQIGLTGTKEGCNDGNCGACTVSLDGRIRLSWPMLFLIQLHEGLEVNAPDFRRTQFPSERLYLRT